MPPLLPDAPPAPGSTAAHVIDEVQVEMTFVSAHDAREHEPDLASLAMQRLLPIVERVFDEWSPAGALIVIDRLELDLGTVSLDEMPVRLAAVLDEALSGLGGRTGETTPGGARVDAAHGSLQKTQRALRQETRAAADLRVLLHFLEHGVVPWEAPALAEARDGLTFDDFVRRVVATSGDALRQALARAPQAARMRTRARAQFPPDVIAALQERSDSSVGVADAAGPRPEASEAAPSADAEAWREGSWAADAEAYRRRADVEQAGDAALVGRLVALSDASPPLALRTLRELRMAGRLHADLLAACDAHDLHLLIRLLLTGGRSDAPASPLLEAIQAASRPLRDARPLLHAVVTHILADEAIDLEALAAEGADATGFDAAAPPNDSADIAAREAALHPAARPAVVPRGHDRRLAAWLAGREGASADEMARAIASMLAARPRALRAQLESAFVSSAAVERLIDLPDALLARLAVLLTGGTVAARAAIRPIVAAAMAAGIGLTPRRLRLLEWRAVLEPPAARATTAAGADAVALDFVEALVRAAAPAPAVAVREAMLRQLARDEPARFAVARPTPAAASAPYRVAAAAPAPTMPTHAARDERAGEGDWPPVADSADGGDVRSLMARVPTRPPVPVAPRAQTADTSLSLAPHQMPSVTVVSTSDMSPRGGPSARTGQGDPPRGDVAGAEEAAGVPPVTPAIDDAAEWSSSHWQRAYEDADQLRQVLTGAAAVPDGRLTRLVDRLLRVAPWQLRHLLRELQAASPVIRPPATLGAAVLESLVLASLRVLSNAPGMSSPAVAAVAIAAGTAVDRAVFFRTLLAAILADAPLDLAAAQAPDGGSPAADVAVTTTRPDTRTTTTDGALATPDADTPAADHPAGASGASSAPGEPSASGAVGRRSTAASDVAALNQVREWLRAAPAATNVFPREPFARLLDRPDDARALLREVRRDTSMMRRLATDGPEPFLVQWLHVLHPASAAEWLQSAEAVASASLAVVPRLVPERLRALRWEFLFQLPDVAVTPGDEARRGRVIERLVQRLQPVDPDAYRASLLEQLRQDRALLAPGRRPASQAGVTAARRTSAAGSDAVSPADPRLDTPLYVGNAGLVLAAPYLPRLFAALGLLDDGQFAGVDAAQRGVHALQYLVDGDGDRPEYGLVLNKVLCGLPVSFPIDRHVELTPSERTTVDGLVAAMVQNWKKLGRTSVAGFRESFLVRGGVLRVVNEAWRLEVEPKAFDVLLDYIPWSYSTIRLGWMQRTIHVEWR